MRKKIVSVILAVILSASLFTGCSLFSYNTERDYKQVVATIKSVTMTDNSSEANKSNPFVTEEKKIYKYDLINQLNTNGANMISYGYSVKDTVDYLINQLVVRELVLNEADKEIHFGNIVWGQNEENQVLEGIYRTIDNQLATFRNEVLDEHGEPTADMSGTQDTTEEKETTYPVEEVVEPGLYDDLTREELLSAVIDRVKKDGDNAEVLEEKYSEYSNAKLINVLEKNDLQSVEKWAPDTLRYPGLYGSDDVKSLEIEAMRRLMSYLDDAVENDYRLTSAQKREFAAELDDLNKIGNEKGIPYIYPALGETKLMQAFAGDEYRDSVKIALLQDFITNDVDVSEEEIVSYYNDLLRQQKEKFDADASAFDSAIGNDDIYYYPNANYYYVKHILVPFSDEQTKELDAYKAGEGALNGKEAVAAYKEKLGKSVKGYEHRDGENYGKPLTIDEIYADIERTMAAASTLKDKDRAFDKLIYKYNTDDGIFGQELGYKVKAVFADGEEYDTTYMEEFSRAADALYRAGVEGAYSPAAVTDYGVHILYLSKIPFAGEVVGLDDYVSYGEKSTVRETIEAAKFNEKSNQHFSVWQNQTIGYYQTVAKIIEKNEKAYKDLYEDEETDEE